MNKLLKHIVSAALIFSLLLSTTGFVVFEHFCACDGESYTTFIPEECCALTHQAPIEKDSCCEEDIQKTSCCENETVSEETSYFDMLTDCSCFTAADYHSSDQFYVASNINFELKSEITSEVIYSEDIVEDKNLLRKPINLELFASLNNFGKSFLIKTNQLKIPTLS